MGPAIVGGVTFSSAVHGQEVTSGGSELARTVRTILVGMLVADSHQAIRTIRLAGRPD
jgi:hypothetical protein